VARSDSKYGSTRRCRTTSSRSSARRCRRWGEVGGHGMGPILDWAAQTWCSWYDPHARARRQSRLRVRFITARRDRPRAGACMLTHLRPLQRVRLVEGGCAPGARRAFSLKDVLARRALVAASRASSGCRGERAAGAPRIRSNGLIRRRSSSAALSRRGRRRRAVPSTADLGARRSRGLQACLRRLLGTCREIARGARSSPETRSRTHVGPGPSNS